MDKMAARTGIQSQAQFDELLKSFYSNADHEHNASHEHIAQQILDRVQAIDTSSADQIGQLMVELGKQGSFLKAAESQRAIEAVFAHVSRRAADAELFEATWIEQAGLEKIYESLPTDSQARNQLLASLAAISQRDSLELFAKLLVEDPPSDERGIVVAVAPLVNEREFDVNALFPTLLEALKYRHLAGIVLDLANYVTRKKYVDQHPAKQRAAQLSVLLGQVVQQLALIEEGKTGERSAEEISRNVNESVALTVSLCDALALCQYTEGIGKIRQAMQLKHRRVKTEAAAALVQLGDFEDEGKNLLVELAAEPIARIRVVSYAQELGFLETIDEQYRSEPAIAESQLALWLAAPSQMGVAPTSMEAVFHQKLRWPGFHNSVDCYLFRFEYRFGQQTYSNIGIAGPVTHAFTCNLEHLEPMDILAAFAGWQTEHEDIYTLDIDRAQRSLAGLTQSFLRRLNDEFENGQPEFVGMFFETPVLVARALSGGDSQENQSQIVILDRDHTFHYCSGAPHSAVTPELAFEIYKGRKLLSAFNEIEEMEP